MDADNNPPAISEDAPPPLYHNASRKHRAKLYPLFEEYKNLAEIQRSISVATTNTHLLVGSEHGNLFKRLAYRERITIGSEPLLPFVGWDQLPRSFAEDWGEAFNLVFRNFSYYSTGYNTAVEYYEKERSQLVSEINFKEALSAIEKGSLIDQLVNLEDLGLTASVLGQIDGLRQCRQILQVAYGLYSYDRRGTLPEAPQNSDHPRASISSFQRRQNMRAGLLSDETLLDPAIPYALCIDLINNEKWFKTWAHKTKPLYSKGVLLMPGLVRVDALLQRIEGNFETIGQARQRFTKEAAFYLKGANRGDAQDTLALEKSRNDNHSASLGMSCLCFVNSLRGYTYAGGTLEDLLAMHAVPDIYQEAEIHYPWENTQTHWDALKRKEASRIKTPPKPPETTEMRRKRAREKYEEAVAAFQAAHLAALDELTQKEIDDIARQRQEKTDLEESRQAQRTQRRQPEKQKREIIKPGKYRSRKRTKKLQNDISPAPVQVKKKKLPQKRTIEELQDVKKIILSKKSKEKRKKRIISDADLASQALLRQTMRDWRKIHGRPSFPTKPIKGKKPNEPHS